MLVLYSKPLRRNSAVPDIWYDVDTALAEVPVNILPLIDSTDFATIEAAIAYNATGLALYWHFVTTAGAYSVTAVTPTTGGAYDWTDQGDAGIYTIEIPASGGASINNDTEGFGWFTGKATGVLPWRGPVIGFRAAALNDALIDNAWSTTRGLAGTALPAAAADAAGGLPISDAGGLDMDAKIGALTFTVAGDVDVNVQSWKGSAAQDMTGDAYARLGAPAGASVSADVAAVKAETAAILDDTDLIDDATSGLAKIATDVAAVLVDTGTTLDGKLNTIDGIVDDILVDTGTTLDGLIKDVPTVAEFEARTIAAANYALEATSQSILEDTGTTIPGTITTIDGIVDDIKAVTVKLDTTLVVDGAVYDFTAAALAAAPTGGSAPTVEQIRAEIDSNSTQLAAIVADTSELQTDLTDGGRLDLLIDGVKAKTDGLNFTGTDVKATLDGEEVTPTAASKTGYTLTAATGLGNQTADITGSLSGSVGSVTGAVGSVAANGITATSIAADAINAASIKADAVTKIQNGLATPTNITAGTITTVTNLTNLPAITTDWMTAAGVSAGAVTKIQAGLSTYAGTDTAGTTTLLSRVVGTIASGTHTAQTGDSFAYLGTNLGLLGANATEAGGTGDQFTGLPAVTLTAAYDSAKTAATQTSVDAIKADTATLLSRITANLFSGITYMKNWLALVMGKSADATTLAEVNATTAGATFLNTTDSLEAIKDTGTGGDDAATIYTYFTDGSRADAFKATVTGLATIANQTVIIGHLTDIKGTGWATETLVQIGADAATAAGATGGTGARTFTITVTDGTDPLEGVRIRMKKGAEDYVVTTDASGEVTVGRDDGTWDVAITLPGYTFTPTTLAVSVSTTAVSYAMTLQAVTPPPTDDTSTVRIYTRLGGVVTAGLLVQMQQREIKTGSTGYGDSSEVRELRSNGSGYVDFTCLRNAEHRWRMGRSGQWVTFTPTTATYVALGSDVGHE